MPKPAQVYILRHGARLDMSSPNWIYTTATPYDPPLTTGGKAQSGATGSRIATLLPNTSALTDSGGSSPTVGPVEEKQLGRVTSTASSLSTSSDLDSLAALSLTTSSDARKPTDPSPASTRIIIHSSPFLRCLQTATHVAASLHAATNIKPILRVDAWLGEWMTPDYYMDISPPPPMKTMISSTKAAFAAREIDNADDVVVDYTWDGGTGAEMGEEWSAMHKRFRRGYEALMEHYANERESPPHLAYNHHGEDDAVRAAHKSTAVLLVTHGAGCNALLGAISKRPVLMDVGIGAMSLASLNPLSGDYDLDIISSTTPTPPSSTSSSTTSSAPHHKHPSQQQMLHPHHAHHTHHASLTGGKLHRSTSSSGTGLWSPHHHQSITPTLVITGGGRAGGLGRCERERERELEREMEAEKERERERELGIGFATWGLDVGMEKDEAEERAAAKEKWGVGGLWKAKGWKEQPHVVKRRWTVGREAAPGVGGIEG